MNPAAWAPHGLALLDYLDGERRAAVGVFGEDGEEERVPAEVFFRGPEEFSALEETALDLCCGRVLDAGAGAGCHSLVLQARGLPVVALDVVPAAVKVLHERGVVDARCGDIFRFQDGPFDTLLLLMNGIGLVEDLPGLDRFLREVGRLLAPDGQILLDSYDPCPPGEPARHPRRQGTSSPGRYPGEMRFRLEYKGARGPSYGWLFVDFDTLKSRAERAGWSCACVWREAEGEYLARLTRRGEGSASPIT